MEWGFSTATRIRFGRDVSQSLAPEARAFGSRAIVVTGNTPKRFSAVIDSLHDLDMNVIVVSCTSEPDLNWIRQILADLRDHDPKVIIGIGGGSAIDAAKAFAALIPNVGDPQQFLEVVGDGVALVSAPLPMIAVPTTSGTGAEVTKNAVISVPESRRKVSLRDDRMLPDLALVDPALTIGLPQYITATTGLDALTQLIEPYLSAKANPMTDAICREGIGRVSHALPKLLKGAENIALREDMSLASVFGGMALANSGLGAVHGLAGVLGGWCGAPHGALCGRMLPAVLRVNAIAIGENQDTGLESRFRDVARWMTGRPDLDGLIDYLEELLKLGAVPRLSAMGVLNEDIPRIAEAARLSSSMKGNPVPLNKGELQDILSSSF
jgi:alcohol dehydrogenase class IV